MAKGEIDEWDLFNIEINLAARKYRRLKSFQEKAVQHKQNIKALIREMLEFRK